jgi:hypothetical protein
VLTIQLSDGIMENIMSSLIDRKFLMPKKYVDTLLEVLREKMRSGKFTGTLYFKTAIACLCPYDPNEKGHSDRSLGSGMPLSSRDYGHAQDKIKERSGNIDVIRDILSEFDPKK